MVAFITELKDDNYQEFVKDGLVLVDIWAEWCSACKALFPTIDQISSEFLGKLKVGKLDAEKAPDIIKELGIRNIPALILYKNGEIVEKKVGTISKHDLSEIIEKHL